MLTVESNKIFIIAFFSETYFIILYLMDKYNNIIKIQIFFISPS